MRGVLRALVVLQVLLPIAMSAAEEKVSVQLNSVENTDNRCRLYFVIENKSQVGIESMKLDLVAFGSEGGILRRLIVEMGPLRPAKTMVRAFAVDADAATSARYWSTTWRLARPANPARVSTALACRRGSRRCASTSRRA